MNTYNNAWLLEQHQRSPRLKFLFFWGHQPAKDGAITASCFSQWWTAPFMVNRAAYATAEHWMMAEKARLFGDHNALQAILQAQSPAEAKKLGRTVAGFDATLWDAHKFEAVKTGNQHKFEQHPALHDYLLTTGERVLVEASPVDAVWGIGLAADHPDAQNPSQWRGENLLGYALMEVRDLLRAQQPTTNTMIIQLLKGDITSIAADAIVNAANSSLLGGGGVDGAIHRKGGPEILEACAKIREAQGGCPTGQAVITTAGKLPAKWVIHTVGPVWGGDKAVKARQLRDCYINSLKLAVAHGAKTVAFPNISTGVYGYPKAEAAAIAVQAVRDFEQAGALEAVLFVCFDDENHNLYQRLL